MSDLFNRLIAKKAEAEQKALLQSIMARYAALYVGGPAHPVSRRPGDNMLGWPLTFGQTTSWKDHITGVLDRGTHYHDQGVIFRLWHERAHTPKLLRLVRGYFDDRFEHLKKEWWEAGPHIDLPMLMFEFQILAQQSGITVYDDDEVQSHWARLALQRYGRKKENAA